MEKKKTRFDHWVEMSRVTPEQRKVIESEIKKLKIGIKILWPILIVSICVLITSLFKTDFKAGFMNSFWGGILAGSLLFAYWSTIILISGYKDIKDYQWDLKRDSFYDNLLAKSVGNLNKEDDQKPA